MDKYPFDEVGVEVLDIEVVHGDWLVQLLKLQPRHTPRIARDDLEAVPHSQAAPQPLPTT